MELRDLIGGLRLLIFVAIISIGTLVTFAITNFDSLQNQPETSVVVDTEKATQKSASQSAAEQLPGYAIFKDWNCGSCHEIDKQKIGPALMNIRGRRSDEWLIKFIKSPSRVIDSGDPYAVKLYEQFKPTLMQNHDIPDEDIISILDYITEASK